MAGFLDRDRIVAGPGFDRWLVPPAALAIHLCIGMAYGFSVFWLPLSTAIGHPCPAGLGLLGKLDATFCDWTIADLGWTYTLFFVFLGLSAATGGAWLERVGPRRAGVLAAVCWSGGLLLAAAGAAAHLLWLIWLGAGVIGGIGLGLGYISPVSTLVRWFPDRRGMATGMAIMGFGGGAMVGAPLANILMNAFRGAGDPGVWQTLIVLAALYAVAMLAGALGYRVPPPGWRPAGYMPGAAQAGAPFVPVERAHRTPQFWLIWLVLMLNVSAGIGVLGVASPMLQEIFGSALIGHPEIGFTSLSPDQRQAVAAIAAGFTGLLSLFNIAGRFAWSSLSDRIGRKTTFSAFFVFGIALYLAAPWLAHAGFRQLFVLAMGIILSMYGGGFATVPAYLADRFGVRNVGAIHGRLLTAWSTAGIVGPVVVNYLRDAQIAAGVARAAVYDRTLLILAGFLAVGLVCNLLVGPVNRRWFVADMATPLSTAGMDTAGGTATWARALAWCAVGGPVGFGVWQTLLTVVRLF